LVGLFFRQKVVGADLLARFSVLISIISTDSSGAQSKRSASHTREAGVRVAVAVAVAVAVGSTTVNETNKVTKRRRRRRRETRIMTTSSNKQQTTNNKHH
jgi:hypothetical protein